MSFAIGLLIRQALGGPNISELLATGTAYFAKEWGLVAAWGIGLLALACGIAAVAALPPSPVRWLAGLTRIDRLSCVARWAKRSSTPVIRPMSGWTKATSNSPPGTYTYVGLELTDDTYVSGPLLSLNPQIGEDHDRSIILAEPIKLRRGDQAVRPVDVHRIVIAADQIRFMTVTFVQELHSEPQPIRSATTTTDDRQITLTELVPASQLCPIRRD